MVIGAAGCGVCVIERVGGVEAGQGAQSAFDLGFRLDRDRSSLLTPSRLLALV